MGAGSATAARHTCTSSVGERPHGDAACAETLLLGPGGRLKRNRIRMNRINCTAWTARFQPSAASCGQLYCINRFKSGVARRARRFQVQYDSQAQAGCRLAAGQSLIGARLGAGQQTRGRAASTLAAIQRRFEAAWARCPLRHCRHLMLALPPPPQFSCCPPSAHRPRIHPRLGRPRPAPQPPNRTQTQAAAAMTVAQPPAEGTYQPRSILVTGGAGEEGQEGRGQFNSASSPCS